MTPEQIKELEKTCDEAFVMAMHNTEEYAARNEIADSEAFKYLMYRIIVNFMKIEKLEARINELEQKQKAHNNA